MSRTGVEAGDFQQVFDEGAQHSYPASDEFGGFAVGEQFGGGDQAHQGGAQFVGDVGGEALFAAQAVLEAVGHRVDGGRDLGDLVALSAARAGSGGQVAGGYASGRTRHPPQSPVGEFGGEGGQGDDDGQRDQ